MTTPTRLRLVKSLRDKFDNPPPVGSLAEAETWKGDPKICCITTQPYDDKRSGRTGEMMFCLPWSEVAKYFEAI